MAKGGFADYVLVPHSRYLFDKGDVDDALASTYACSGLTAYSALKKIADRQAGDEVLIIGAGGCGHDGSADSPIHGDRPYSGRYRPGQASGGASLRSKPRVQQRRARKYQGDQETQ